MSFVLLCPLPPTLWLLLARLLLYSILQQNESCKIDPIFLLQKVVNVLSPPRKYFIMKKYYSSDPRAKATIIGNRDVTCKKSTSIESRRLWMLTQIHFWPRTSGNLRRNSKELRGSNSFHPRIYLFFSKAWDTYSNARKGKKAPIAESTFLNHLPHSQ